MHPILRLAIAALLAAPVALHAQRTPREVNIDIGVVGASLGYAIQSSPGQLFGVQVGLGGDWINRTVVAGEHFKEAGGDGMLELGHVALFRRGHYGRHFSLDVGARIAPFLHSNDLDDDPGLALFAGAYAMPMIGIGGRFAIGPRILAGALTEGAGKTEFGINVAALVGRVTFGR